MGLYYPELADSSRAAAAPYPHVQVFEVDRIGADGRPVAGPGWKHNGRAGGYANTPRAVVNHHTAHTSTTYPGLWSILRYEHDKYGQNPDGSWKCGNNVHGHYDPDAGVAILFVLAAGPSFTNGEGRAVTLPDGSTIPADAANSWTITIEAQNNGLGAPYPEALVDAILAFDVGTLRMLGRDPRNVIQHQTIAGYRGKSCLAHAGPVQGRFKPGVEPGTSITWNLAAVRNEVARRSAELDNPTNPTNPTTPTPTEDDEMFVTTIIKHADRPHRYGTNKTGGGKVWLPSSGALEWQRTLLRLNGLSDVEQVYDDDDKFAGFGPILAGIAPTDVDVWGNPKA